ncbi:hypothetical protein [Synechococcus sp. NB0720_010]|uniref:hypothetical protein n=1 Tax=Synechococcus sp. NB0720_010 TaxID=2907159 RepID=UPI001FFAC286|nr:hypothetical protein [Synechococcus sp. NB0720_010]UPH91074.1 hypothetical protein LY254_05190 [Synechococcus sp. NB0720_010]
MSDLADAVFGGQLMGHVIAGEELTHSVIADAAMTADLAASMALTTDGSLSDVEHQILEAKVAQSVVEDGAYTNGDFLHDQLDLQLDSEIANSYL